MRYYFAGAYERRAELKAYAERLHAARIGAMVLSRWLTQDQTGEDAGFKVGGMETESARSAAWSYGRRDLEDLSCAQVIVSFTGEGTRGGRHVEHGYAMALSDSDDPRVWRPRLVVVGPREHVFHCHPATEVYPDFEAFLNHEIQQNREETQ
jgi:hypothetical protein